MNTVLVKGRRLVMGAILSLAASTLTVSAMADVNEITDVAYRGDSQSLQEMAASSDSDYAKAYAHWRLAAIQMAAQSQGQALQSIDQVIGLLAGTTNPESQIILASAYGMKAALNPSQMQVFGVRSNQLLASALGADSDNPRALLLQAINAFYTPEQYGGGSEAASIWMQQAMQAFESERANASHSAGSMTWGYAEAWVWQGLIDQKQERLAEAKAAWQRALELQPHFAWPQFLLQAAG